MKSLIPAIQEVKVSSVLNNDRKVYGKKFLFDGKDETCWNSDQGSPQWIKLQFSLPTTIEKLNLQFQGGFAGKDCELEAYFPEESEATNNDHLTRKPKFQFAPDDNNAVQEFSLPEPITATHFRLSFNTSTDFYGRIILYNCDIIGTSGSGSS